MVRTSDECKIFDFMYFFYFIVLMSYLHALISILFALNSMILLSTAGYKQRMPIL
jgi:hypothetical protein